HFFCVISFFRQKAGTGMYPLVDIVVYPRKTPIGLFHETTPFYIWFHCKKTARVCQEGDCGRKNRSANLSAADGLSQTQALEKGAEVSLGMDFLRMCRSLPLNGFRER